MKITVSKKICVNDVCWEVVTGCVCRPAGEAQYVSLSGSSSLSLMRISVAWVALRMMRCTFEYVVGFCKAPPAPGTEGPL